jgi:hypothetical protein
MEAALPNVNKNCRLSLAFILTRHTIYGCITGVAGSSFPTSIFRHTTADTISLDSRSLIQSTEPTLGQIHRWCKKGQEMCHQEFGPTIARFGWYATAPPSQRLAIYLAK